MASKISASDRERFAQARVQGRERSANASALLHARYDRRNDMILLEFRGGGRMMIPRGIVPGLEGVPRSSLQAIMVSPAGDALSWRSLDVDVYVPGLVERAFGARLFSGKGRRNGVSGTGRGSRRALRT